MKGTGSEKTGFEKGTGKKAGILVDPSLRKDVIEIAADFRAATELRDGLEKIFKGLKTFARRQKDLDKNAFKKFLILSCSRVLKEELGKIECSLGEIELKAKAVGATIQPLEGEGKAAGSSSPN